MHLRRRLVDRITGSWMVISLITILLSIIIGAGLYYKSIPILRSIRSGLQSHRQNGLPTKAILASGLIYQVRFMSPL